MLLFLLMSLLQDSPAPVAHFHHLRLNSTDPAAAVRFYTSKLPSEQRKYPDGSDAVFAHNVWLLFNKVSAPPKSEITSPIWHMGWGGDADMQATYKKQVDSGTKFFVPITDITDLCDGKGGRGTFYFAYVDAPDHALIELNTTAAGQTYFGHVHLLSADPIAASDWYVKEFGLKRRGTAPPSREVRYRCGRQTAPSASLMMDDVNVIIYPVGNAQAAFPDAWKDRKELESSAGHSIESLGFSVPDLDATLARLKADGVTILSPARGKVRTATIEGPDHIRVELTEPRP